MKRLHVRISVDNLAGSIRFLLLNLRDSNDRQDL
jgi:hypothetical protein